MHFFYLDETGCTGADLNNPQQPIFVLGGISVKAQGWRETTDQFRRATEEFFDGAPPAGFELHATDLVNGQGAFAAHCRDDRKRSRSPISRHHQRATARDPLDRVQARRLKWLVEVSYPVDSVRHPMVQVSDLVIFLARKFLEVENGYRDSWPPEAKNFYAGCYEKIIQRVKWATLIDVRGREECGAHTLLAAAQSTHGRQWRRRYDI